MSQAGSSGAGGGGGFLNKLTGNIGGPVSQFNNNINVVGDGTSIDITGNPLTHTLTANVIANRYIESLTADVGGVALPTAGNINILGGTNVTTTRSGSTITISSTTHLPVYTDVNASPYVVLVTDNYLSVDTSLIAITVQLPDAPLFRRVFTIKDRIGNAAIRNISITTITGVVLIDGVATYVMNTNFQSINVIWNGTSYEIF